MITLKTPVEKLVGVGPKMATKLSKLGIENVKDLLYHFPFRYDDFSKITPIIKVSDGTFCIKGKVLDIRNSMTPRKRIFVTNAIIQDKTTSIKVVWFNQWYLTNILKKGTEVVLAGRVEYNRDGLTLQNPTYEISSPNTTHVGRIVPVYPETSGLSSKWLRKTIKPLLKLTEKFLEYLPESILKENNLIGIAAAFQQIHFPDSMKSANDAKKRISFDELLLLQLKMLEIKKSWQSHKAPKIPLNIKLVKHLLNKLPYKLTNAQRKTTWEILKDMNRSIPMNRLLEGDVGSGKTIVAAIAMLLSAKAGFQSIIMAPTEVLAHQHFESLSKLLSPYDLKIGLLVGSKADIFPKVKNITKPEIISQIKNGKIDIVVGTHALISEKTNFEKVGLVIIDEQHRFGIKQRAILRKKSHTTPHLLSMTATPIPRTLTLALYGDLDLSIIDEMPVGRQKVSTFLVGPEKREKAYGFINDQIKNGQQIFVICPLIEESDKLGIKSAETEYKKLKTTIFPKLKIALLHGKMKPKEKEKIMKDFKKGKSDILVSTAVIEVGVDIPNATVMMIEGADRFGLAQLHQFRGRVGRGSKKSYCFLFTDSNSFETKKRLMAMEKMNDGFRLAEKDLELRGPGEIYGTHQHGFPDLKMASLFDIKVLKMARSSAEKVLAKGLNKYPKLKTKLQNYQKERSLE